MLRSATGLLALGLACVSAPAPDADSRTHLLFLGTIHGRHRTSTAWGLAQLEAAIRDFEPDVVCCELPPDRWERIERDWQDGRRVEDERLRVFPEYVDVLLPLRDELGFDVEPCAAWTREMSDQRQARLAALETDPSLAGLSAEYERRAAEVSTRGLPPLDDIDDPRVIHSEAYDLRVEQELAPFDEVLGDYLGPGGWTRINEAHMALLEAALDRHRGRRVLIMFGAGHKGWMLRRLRQREDLRLEPYRVP